MPHIDKTAESDTKYGMLYIKFPDGSFEEHPIFVSAEECERLSAEKKRLEEMSNKEKEWLNNLPQFSGGWKMADKNTLPADGEEVAGISMWGDLFRFRYNHKDNLWEAFYPEDCMWLGLKPIYWIYPPAELEEKW